MNKNKDKISHFRFIFLLFFLFLQTSVFSQDIHILKRIDSLQSRGTEFYRKGLFPCQISFENSAKTHEDNNIFFTAETIYTLQSLRNYFGKSGKTIIDSISDRAKHLYVYYRNRQGRPTYNFYQTHPDKPFPGLKFWTHQKWLRLTDDLDDVSFIYLIRNTSDSLNAAVKKLMELQTRSPKKVVSTFRKYQNSKAYRTWFAFRMKQDLDICVMSNVLLFVYQKHLPLDSTDYSTIALIKQMVNDNDIMKHPNIVSAHYQKSPIILYHLARLISKANNPQLNSLIPKIVADLKSELNISTNQMDKIILISSLYRLHHPVGFEFNYRNILNDMNTFHWFRANPFSGDNVIYKRIMGRNGWLNFKYKCNAFYWSLVLELQQLSGAHIQTNGNFLQTKMYKVNYTASRSKYLGN